MHRPQTAWRFIETSVTEKPRDLTTTPIGFNLLIATLKPQSNGPSYCNTWYTLAVDGWVVTFGTARRGLGEAAARPGPSSLYQI